MRWLGVIAAAVALAACRHTPDEQRIREAVAAMRTAVEARDPRGFMQYVSTDFTGNDGQVDRDGLHNLLRAQVLRNESVGVTLGPIDVDLQGDRATVHVTATLTGGSGGWLPERGSIYSITSGWKREKGDWQCLNASWERKL
ncbi:MAG: nuclear transport factor 2 family protein [Xanthomonadaceae bacterium]|nr:nuclear transport factor 2 family protein [Xanthomonadaceae bacterium]